MKQQIKEALKAVGRVVNIPPNAVQKDTICVMYTFFQFETDTGEKIIVEIDVKPTIRSNAYEVEIYHIEQSKGFNRLAYRPNFEEDQTNRLKEALQTFANLNGWPPATFEE